MSLQCPCCQPPRIAMSTPARRLGATVGAIGGAACVLSSAFFGRQTKDVALLLGAIVGAANGCLVGAKLGLQLDHHVIDSNLCLICGHRFNLPT